MHAATLALLTKTAKIFWEHEVFWIVVITTWQFISFLHFFSKKCENNEKISVLILVLITNVFLICHPYVTMPNVSLK